MEKKKSAVKLQKTPLASPDTVPDVDEEADIQRKKREASKIEATKTQLLLDSS